MHLLGYIALLVIAFILTGCLGTAEDRPSSPAKPGSASVLSEEPRRPAPPESTRNGAVDPSIPSARDNHGADLGPTSLRPRKETDPRIRVLSDEDTAFGKPAGRERITGYRTPGEYLTLSSKYVADATTAITLPKDYEIQPQKTYPLVIAFGGAGECAKPPRSGAMAWMRCST